MEAQVKKKDDLEAITVERKKILRVLNTQANRGKA